MSDDKQDDARCQLRERANVKPRIEEMRKYIEEAYPDMTGLLSYLLTTIEYQQREIEQLRTEVDELDARTVLSVAYD